MTLILQTIALALSIEPSLLQGLCWIESNHRPKVINENDGGSPSYGLCQIKLETAQLFNPNLDADDLMIPERNAYYAAKYLQYQIGRYPGNMDCAISAYNAGRCIQSNQETYVKKVKTAQKRFAQKALTERFKDD